MKLLFDQQLSRRLVGRLSDLYPQSEHTSNLALGRATDADVYRAARNGGFVLVTVDADFLALSARFGRPPLVVHLRAGNCTLDVAEQLLRTAAGELAAAVADPQVRLVEVVRA